MGDVAVAADLIRGVDYHHALAELVSKQARAFAQHRRLADARPPEQQDALAADHDVADDLARPGDRTPDTHREAGDAAGSVADRGNAVEGALDAGAVVVAELPDVVGDMVEV